MSLHEREGYVPVDGYRVWFRVVGGGAAQERAPLLILHGGPGAPHDYLENLQALASDERRVIFYDQLGCGRSDQPDDPALCVVSRFADEVETMRGALGLERVHILGQSWGGMLALEYSLRQPPGLVSLVLANTSSSIPLWVAEANRLRAELPAEVNATLLRHEQAGTTESQEYHEAEQVYNERHVCRIFPLPDFVKRSFDQIGFVYNYMNGPSEFYIVGVIKDWDVTDRLSEIHIPTLIISGLYDESTPRQNEILHQGIAGSEWLLLQHSSHLAHVEEPDLYMQTVQDFLSRVETTQRF